MKKYEIGLSVIMIDTSVIEAKNEKDAIRIAKQESELSNVGRQIVVDYVEEV